LRWRTAAATGATVFDLCDSTHCQVSRRHRGHAAAALATAGQILTFEGQPAEVFIRRVRWFRIGLGRVARRQLSYLRSVVDDVDGDVPWTVDLTFTEIESALRRAGFTGTSLTQVDVDTRSASGRATRVRVTGLEPGVVAGEQFRAAVGAAVIRSTAFTVTRTDAGVRLVGRGYGHGVGLCVIGAGRRAMQGASFRDILALCPGLALTRRTHC
jgi:SpoIID/LytB domain protein